MLIDAHCHLTDCGDSADPADFKNYGDSADSANFAKNGDSADFKNCGDSADSSDSANFARNGDSTDFEKCGDSSNSANCGDFANRGDSSDSANFAKNGDSIFLKRIKKILLESEKAGVSALITSASRPADFPKILKLVESEENVFATIGVHPFYTEEFKQMDDFGDFTKLLNHPKILGIGEIGLDFSPKYKATAERQIAVLERQLAIAHDFQKPIILHCVGKNATATLLQTLKKFKNGNGRKIAHNNDISHGENSDALQFRKSGIAHNDAFGESGIWRGILHGFGGSVEEAKVFIKLGFKISFNGNLLKPNFKRVRQLAETLPTDSILIESDYPYTTHPANLPQILTTLAHLRQTPPGTLQTQLHHNTRTAFNYYFPR